jgi:glucuronoxylan 4-O-methyltransferase
MTSALKTLRNALLARPSIALAARWPARVLLRAMRRVNGIQLTAAELAAIAGAVRRRGACSLLVVGLGHDAPFWLRVNRRGRTVFLEDDAAWRQAGAQRNPGALIELVAYGTRRAQWKALLDAPEALAMTLPAPVEASDWDVVIVDAPAGWSDDSPGRMKSIRFAARLAASGADVFVHDCDREVERAYCDRFLGPANLVAEIGRLRHYRMPRVRASTDGRAGAPVADGASATIDGLDLPRP